MPAPEGNKYAVGNSGGRPSNFNIEKMAEELIKWALTDEALILREFAPIHGFSCKTMYRWAVENEVFREAFDQARDIIGCRREAIYLEKTSEYPYKRYATYYDEALKTHERDEKKFDSDLKKEADGHNKQHITIHVDGEGLARGAKLRSKELPTTNNNSTKSRD